VSEVGGADSAVAAPGRHYAWVVVGVTFCTMLVAAGIRAAPGVLLLSLEREMGWSRAAIAFAVVFGLDYIATVPPTSALTADIFGRRNVGTVFGWVFFSHQVGAALAAYLGGVARVALGDYQFAFLVAGTLAVLAALMALRVDRGARPALQPASVPA
jgi:sugar phosphate permease